MSDSVLQFNPQEFEERLKRMVRRPLTVRWNENVSTMISIREKPDQVRVSIHRMFLSAPQEVLEEVARYVQGRRRSPGPVIRAYIEEQCRQLDYQHKVSRAKLDLEGHQHDLQKIFDDLNREYFMGKLQLSITWYGLRQRRRRACSHVTFGLYSDPLKLIKIHRLLDDPRVPDFVVRFVVYHEMLHAALPGYIDEKGRNRVHHPQFLAAEKSFPYYQQANQWIAENQAYIFGGRRKWF